MDRNAESYEWPSINGVLHKKQIKAKMGTLPVISHSTRPVPRAKVLDRSRRAKMLKNLILKNPSYHRFHQDSLVALETLTELVELARFSASGANRQPLKYILCCDPEVTAKVFPHLVWAG